MKPKSRKRWEGPERCFYLVTHNILLLYNWPAHIYEWMNEQRPLLSPSEFLLDIFSLSSFLGPPTTTGFCGILWERRGRLGQKRRWTRAREFFWYIFLGKKYSKELGRGEREICFPCSVEKCEKYKGEETSSTSCLSLSNAADLNDPFLFQGEKRELLRSSSKYDDKLTAEDRWSFKNDLEPLWWRGQKNMMRGSTDFQKGHSTAAASKNLGRKTVDDVYSDHMPRYSQWRKEKTRHLISRNHKVYIFISAGGSKYLLETIKTSIGLIAYVP